MGYNKFSKLLNKDVLSLLLDAINEAYALGEPQPQYSDLQLITFYENIVNFIHYELRSQAGEITHDLPFFFHRDAPKGFTGKNDKGETVYLLHDYYIQAPKPLLDFYSFKHSLRNLLINSQNPDQLKKMLKPSVEKVKAIIKLWNAKIQPLETGKGNSVSYRRLIKFKENIEDWTVWNDEDFLKFQETAFHYTNHDLVKFAGRAGSVVASEVLESSNKEPIPEVKPNPVSKLTHLLRLYYEKDCKPLKKQQVEELARTKEIPVTSLINRWGILKRDMYRHNGKIQNIQEFIKSYKILLQEFVNTNSKAHKNVQNHYEQLKETYPDLAY